MCDGQMVCCGDCLNGFINSICQKDSSGNKTGSFHKYCEESKCACYGCACTDPDVQKSVRHRKNFIVRVADKGVKYMCNDGKDLVVSSNEEYDDKLLQLYTEINLLRQENNKMRDLIFTSILKGQEFIAEAIKILPKHEPFQIEDCKIGECQTDCTCKVCQIINGDEL